MKCKKLVGFTEQSNAQNWPSFSHDTHQVGWETSYSKRTIGGKPLGKFGISLAPTLSRYLISTKAGPRALPYTNVLNLTLDLGLAPGYHNTRILQNHKMARELGPLFPQLIEGIYLTLFFIFRLGHVCCMQ